MSTHLATGVLIGERYFNLHNLRYSFRCSSGICRCFASVVSLNLRNSIGRMSSQLFPHPVRRLFEFHQSLTSWEFPVDVENLRPLAFHLFTVLFDDIPHNIVFNTAFCEFPLA